MDSSIPELFDLRQKVALVTGGAVGIGARIAERLGEAGASVAIADVDYAGASRSAARVRSFGAPSAAFACDVGRLDEITRLVAAVVAEFGRVDIVVNNAGIFPVAPALEVTESLWTHVFDVNLKGAFFLAQCAARQMIESGTKGSIVNIASIDGLHPSGSLAHYDASKAGLIMMTRSLALELGAKRIRVNAIAPGAIQTPGVDIALSTMAGSDGAEALKAKFSSRIPLGRLGDPDDIACAALFLASRASNYVTGSTLLVDGGFLLT